MKTLVFGSAGQLGRDLVPGLRGTVIAVTRSDADLSGTGSAADCIRQHRPDLVINSAAYNLVDKAESEPTAAFAVNTWAVRDMAIACRETGARFVHISTDYVFGLNADRTTPYTEDDAPGPLSIYGLSKLNGEYLARSYAPRHLVIRTCGLYGVWGSGGKGGNFVETMLRVAGMGKPLRVVDDQFCTPSYTKDVASAILRLIETDANGLFHITNAGACSWYELAREIFRQSGIAADLTPIPTRERNDPARRPPYSVLSNAKYASLGLHPARPWREALSAYLQERTQKPSS